MGQTILVTGASGLIGTKLCDELLNQGYSIHALTRGKKDGNERIRYFSWDVDRQYIDEACLQGVSAIIHLAGENIAARPWTNAQKQRLVRSRTESIRLILQVLRARPHTVTDLISASASGYYGDRGDEILKENSHPGNDFLSYCCLNWENAVNEAKALGLRVVKLRTGTVLSNQGGALKPIIALTRAGLAAPLAGGKQWVPWIHIDDLVQMYIYTLKNGHCRGAYNMSSPNAVTNKTLMNTVASTLKKPLWLPAVPAFLMRVILGEMHTILSNSNRMDSSRIIDSGFTFKFTELSTALAHLYGRKKQKA